MPPDASTAQSFSLVAAFLRADAVVKLVMIGLGLASLWSWTIILDKAVRMSALNRRASAFEDEVASGRPLEEIAAAQGQTRDALPRMLVAAVREFRETKRPAGGLSEGQAALLISRVDRALDAVMAGETRRVESGLGSLAIVATASPFIGLFGTVWGIMHAFQAIAGQKSTNLTVVAPAIAEALFATAIGLVAAIPAYIAYNAFSTAASKFAGRLEAFADEVGAAIARRVSGG